MTDILELAREAGLGAVLCHGSVEGDRVWIEGADWHDELERFAELLEAKVRADERELLEALKAKMNDINISKRTFWWRFMNFLGYRRVFYLQSEVYRGGCSIFCWVYHPRIPKRDYTQIDSPFINQFYPRKKDAPQKNALNEA